LGFNEPYLYNKLAGGLRHGEEEDHASIKPHEGLSLGMLTKKKNYSKAKKLIESFSLLAKMGI